MLKDEQDDRQGDPCPGPNGVVTTRRPPNSDSASAGTAGADRRLRLNPNNDHKPESYDDLQLDYKASIFSSLERHLPSCMLGVSREEKVQFMSEILARYLPDSERVRVQKHSEYRQKIMANYQPLHKALYDTQPAAFFVPSFVNAINENNKQTLRSIIREPSPGIYTFSMLHPNFCEMLLAEVPSEIADLVWTTPFVVITLCYEVRVTLMFQVENFEKWVQETRCKIMRPNTMNKYGAVLDDFGMESMLNQLMHQFVSPMSKVFFPEVGGSSLDSHHGFIVEYGEGKDVSLGFHVDDSEVTLNICLGKQFSGGDLFFRGVRCDKHVNSETLPEESFEYSHVPGQAILHRGRHRHGARPTTSGNRINLLLWCRSSVFRELIRYQKDFSSWCGECLREKKERHDKMVAATKLEFLRRGESMI